MYCKFKLLICLHFPMVAIGKNKEGMSLHIASSHFKCHVSALMWLCNTLKKSSWTKKKNRKELIKHIECGGVLVQCE